MSCDFCGHNTGPVTNSILADKRLNSGRIALYNTVMIEQKNLVSLVTTSDCSVVCENKVKINFCPKCGEKID